jgi:hypothetical protein
VLKTIFVKSSVSGDANTGKDTSTFQRERNLPFCPTSSSFHIAQGCTGHIGSAVFHNSVEECPPHIQVADIFGEVIEVVRRFDNLRTKRIPLFDELSCRSNSKPPFQFPISSTSCNRILPSAWHDPGHRIAICVFASMNSRMRGVLSAKRRVNRTTRKFPLFFVPQSGILPHPAKHLSLFHSIFERVVRVVRSAFEFSPEAA